MSGDFIDMIIGDNDSHNMCQYTDQQVHWFLAPYYILMIARCVAYVTIAFNLAENMKSEDQGLNSNILEFLMDQLSFLTGEKPVNQ